MPSYLLYFFWICLLIICSYRKTVQSQYNAQKAGITTAIVVAVLLPIGICAFCFLLYIRNKAVERREEKEGVGGGATTNRGPIRA